MREILLLRDFAEEQRLSMELYADMLERSINALKPRTINVSAYSPVIPAWLKTKKSGIRIARFYSYPRQVLHQKAALFHIVDHGYGQLIHFLDPNKTVVTVHDLMALARWKGIIQGVRPGHFPLLALISVHAIKKAAHLIAVSNNTKNDLVRLLGCDPNKISVIYSGIDPAFMPFDLQRRKTIRGKWFDDNENKKILITGSQFYKNHETAIKTLMHLHTIWSREVQLVKTGQLTPEWLAMVRDYGMEGKVIDLGVIPRELLPELYNAVDLLLFPSVYEGFGWPPLEAMACGIPVVTSDAGPLPEVMGNMDSVCEPLNFIGFADKIKKLLSDDIYRRRLIEQGFHQASKFNWIETANRVLAVYENVLNRD